MTSELESGDRQFRIAYRNRYVNYLTQELFSDCSSQEPLKLSSDKARVTLELTQTEFTQLFSAVLTGADILYPETAHQVSWLLWGAVECPPEPEPEPATYSGAADQGGQGYGGGTFDDLLDLLMELDVKFQMPDGSLYEPAIPLVPCGCGDSVTDTRTPTPNIPGATSGSAGYGDFTTLCDFSTTVIPWILDSVDDVMGRIGSGAFFTQGFLILNEALQTLVQDLRDSVNDIENELIDPDFIELAKKKAIEAFNDPVTELNRADLRAFARSMPLVFEGAPMWSAFVIWSEVANLEALNAQIKAASGTGNANECELLFAQVGREPFSPGGVAPSAGGLEVLETSQPNYKVYRIPFNRDTDSTFQEEFPVPAGEIFRGYIWDNVYVTADTTGGASASIMRKTPSNQEWQFFLSDRNSNPNRWTVYINSFVAVQDIEQSLFLEYGGGKTRVPKSENAVSLDTDTVTALSVANNAKFLNIGSPNEMFIGTLYIISEIKNP